MTPKEAIDQVLTDYDLVADDDADNTPRRARLLRWLQRVYRFTWNFRSWSWTWTETTFTITNGNNSKTLATAIPNYLQFGQSGSLFDTARSLRMREKTRYLFERIRHEAGGSGFWPIFAIFDSKIHIPYTVTTDTQFLAFHRRTAEAIVDGTTEMLMPDHWVRDVVFLGLVYLAQKGKQDARDDFGANYREALIQMCIIENPLQTAVRRLPLAVPGAW